jgi:hypothetical protein
MKRKYLILYFVISSLLVVVGAILKIEGSRELGNRIMMFALSLHFVALIVFFIRQASNLRNRIKQ